MRQNVSLPRLLVNSVLFCILIFSIATYHKLETLTKTVNYLILHDVHTSKIRHIINQSYRSFYKQTVDFTFHCFCPAHPPTHTLNMDIHKHDDKFIKKFSPIFTNYPGLNRSASITAVQ